MHGLLLVALSAISLMCLPLCDAAPYYDTELDNPYLMRQHYNRRPDEGRQMAQAALRNAMMRERIKKAVEVEPLDDRKRSIEFADRDNAPLQEMASFDEAIYTPE